MLGHQIRSHFVLDKDKLFVNHGSYGSVPKAVWSKYQEMMLKDLSFPDEFTIKEQQDLMKRSLKILSELVNTSFENLALVPNATSGITVVLRSLDLKKEDKFLIPSTIYGACANNIDYLSKRIGFSVTVLNLEYPLEDDEVIRLYEDELKSGEYKYCFFDAVTSMPGVRVPYEKLVQLSRKYEAMSIVDGAHSVGLIDLDLDAVKPDFYTSNLHKWLFLPRGAAFLYVDPKHQDSIQPLPISHTYKNSKFYQRFLFTASNNYTSFFCLEEALKFRQEVCGGEKNIQDYCFGLARQVLNTLGGQDKFENSTESLTTAMVNVKVDVSNELLQHIKDHFLEFKAYTAHGMFAKDSFVPVAYTESSLFVRYSCQVYNELEDYRIAHSKFLEVLKSYEQTVFTK
ncbi:hypothetical protein KL921_002828 [Ogataea angusta]|uniref:Aminotransferase class V domain-containing protein n=1 Tax=Pichia angusta TaxID=870730 RepID=A0AAN6I546_PICAN|nr:uncharacterized protein KL928_003064 [Ogataea angusta]KAG7810333.1 hypothetical protein KL921_002828 [Ogataea angusta]KAG7818063.1 hypothetical protein KL928_003064 [Ogataea angusta]KAG7842477.1 hypothetical protein KL941_005141 [Ogataea angusta]KAG7858762.1 hypothetical protein KL939_002884 [Ogataea angusta]